jgi:hypothetical protein
MHLRELARPFSTQPATRGVPSRRELLAFPTYGTIPRDCPLLVPQRTIQSFQEFFTTVSEELTSKIVFICSDVWKP